MHAAYQKRSFDEQSFLMLVVVLLYKKPQKCIKKTKNDEFLFQKSSWICKSNSFSEKQRWKLDGNALLSKDTNWTSPDTWDFITQHEETNDTFFLIEKTSSQANIHVRKVLGTTNDNKLDFFNYTKKTQHVSQEDLINAPPEQMWIKGIADVEGYFTLENLKDYFTRLENDTVPKVLTATSSSDFEIKGNIILRWIPGQVTNKLLIIYHADF